VLKRYKGKGRKGYDEGVLKRDDWGHEGNLGGSACGPTAVGMKAVYSSQQRVGGGVGKTKFSKVSNKEGVSKNHLPAAAATQDPHQWNSYLWKGEENNGMNLAES